MKQTAFLREKTEIIHHIQNIQYLYLLNKYIKCNLGGSRCGTSTIVDIRRLKVNEPQAIHRCPVPHFTIVYRTTCFLYERNCFAASSSITVCLFHITLVHHTTQYPIRNEHCNFDSRMAEEGRSSPVHSSSQTSPATSIVYLAPMY